VYYAKPAIMATPLACISDTTPPTFSGITSAVAQTNGSIKVNFPAASDVSAPIRYRIYIAAGSVSAGALFVPGNIVDILEPSGAGPYSKNIYTLADQTTYLAIDGLYTFGVRAVDALGNAEFNSAIVTESSFGVLPDCLVSAASSLAASLASLDTIVSQASLLAGGVVLESPINQATLESNANQFGELISKDDTEVI
jgi:hypothetical protein